MNKSGLRSVTGGPGSTVGVDQNEMVGSGNASVGVKTLSNSFYGKLAKF